MKFHCAVLFSFLLVCCFNAFAGEKYVCNNGNAKRIINVKYENIEERLPCEVQYDKGEGLQTLWTAKTETGYCESKASEFVAKQESWGWSCEKAEQAVYAEDLISDVY